MRMLVLIAAAFAQAVAAQPIKTEVVAGGLNYPLFAGHAPADFDRLFVLEKNTPDDIGRIRIVQDGELLETPFLELPVKTDGEAGLLGLAFHPDYDANGHFYVNYTDFGAVGWGRTRVTRFSRSADDANLADPESAHEVISFDQPAWNHNAGWIGFGPDGLLYVSAGDGGSSSNGQNVNTVLGAMLRVDVDADDFPEDDDRNYAIPADNPFAAGGGAPEIWAYGLRNPWRNSFDRLTGDLYIGDVGANAWEEIDYQPANDAGGANYGWACAEGPNINCDVETVAPIHAFDHGDGCIVTGGYVYRGCAIPELVGRYFFGAGCVDRVWSFRVEDGQAVDFLEHTDLLQLEGNPLNTVISFGEDAYGELYITDSSDGEVVKIIRDGPPVNDCNANGVEDACEILDGSVADKNANGTPDECECAADFNGDGVLNVVDFVAFQIAWKAQQAEADCDVDGEFTIADFVCYQELFVDGC